MKKFFLLFIMVSMVSTQFLAVHVSAQELGTLLPKPTEEDLDCNEILTKLERFTGKSKDGKTTGPQGMFKDMDSDDRNDVLACGIKTGKINFWMIPHFIVYFIEFLIGISALIAILFIVISGYQFIIAGATDKRDQAKGTVMYAVLGLVLVSVAWVVVNIIQYVLTI
jgi:hypothetical protein